MALKLELKPNERFILGNAVISNGDMRTTLFIDGDAPVLREKDILTPDAATSPARNIYLIVQLMYLDRDVASHQDNYFRLTREFLEAAPSAVALVDRINNDILTQNLYKALKSAKKLIAYEQELITNAKLGSTCLRTDGAEVGEPA